MTTSAIAAHGVTLTRNGNTIAEIVDVDGIEIKRDMIDVTSLNPTADYREFIPGLIDGGEVKLSGNFLAGDTNGQIGLMTDLENGTLQTFVLTFPTAITATWTFYAYVTALSVGGFKPNEKVPFTASMKISGQPTLAITASTGLTTPFFVISESAVVVPAASGSVYDYVATVLTGVSSVTVTPTASAGVIKVNGSTVATGVPSSAISLGSAGSVTTITVTVTETGKTTKTYTIRLARAAA
jgi:hypothetical protein